LGDGLAGAQNKAGAFAEKWLKPYLEAQGITYSTNRWARSRFTCRSIPSA
jgi:hypothetical protein